jgi:hypothetical protein
MLFVTKFKLIAISKSNKKKLQSLDSHHIAEVSRGLRVALNTSTKD